MKKAFPLVFLIANLLLPTALSAQVEPSKGEATPPATLQVPLVDRATLGGQIRVRGEYKDPVDYRLPGANGRSAAEDVRDGDEFASLRVRLNLDLDVRKDVKTFIQIQDSRTFGEEGYVLTDMESTDFHQGWIRGSNLLGVPLSVTAGRIEVPNLGDGRMVSCSDWNNVGRAWDGAATVFAPQDFWLYGSYAVVREDAGTNGRDEYFGALYASYRGVGRHEFDAYLFRRDFRDDPVTGEDGQTGDVSDFTAGLRIKGATSGFDYSAEGAFQTGDYATDGVSANLVALKAGYTFDIDWKPRVGIEVVRASGDDDPSDGDRGTFNPLLPTTHPFNGIADLVIAKNVRTFMLATQVQPTDRVTVMLDGHLFRLDEERDAWYGTSTTSVRGGGPPGATPPAMPATAWARKWISRRSGRSASGLSSSPVMPSFCPDRSWRTRGRPRTGSGSSCKSWSISEPVQERSFPCDGPIRRRLIHKSSVTTDEPSMRKGLLVGDSTLSLP